MNIGNPGEFTMLELAELVLELTGPPSAIVHEPMPPTIRSSAGPTSPSPGTCRWEPKMALHDGLAARSNGTVTLPWLLPASA